MPKAKTFEQFLEDCKKVDNYENFIFFGDTYNGALTKMKIQCRKCQDIFWRTPANHIFLKQSCGKCVGTKKHTLQSFIDKSNIVHKNKYDYSKSVYVTNKNSVIIICPVHGEFTQRPDDHMKGRGCDRCGGSSTMNTEEFISKAKALHGETYTYDKVKYKRNSIKVTITCSKHGDFLQKPNGHLLGYGCPKCLYKNETKTGEYLKELFGVDADKKLFEINRENIKRAIVDFYFTYNGKQVVVEYHGSQHYTDKPWNGMTRNIMNNAERFARQQKRDKYLREYCRENNIILLEIDGRSYYGDKIKTYLQSKLLPLLMD